MERTRNLHSHLTQSRVLLALLVLTLLLAAYSVEWTGFVGKKLWDWLDLLIVPAVITVGAYWFDQQQRKREQESQDARRAQELEVEKQRARESALESYLSQMGELLLDRGLRGSGGEDEVRTLARAYTLAVLGRLGPEEKRSVLRFLRDARLITRERPVISLDGADLTGAHLSEMLLLDTNLNGAFLDDANLDGAILNVIQLSGEDLIAGRKGKPASVSTLIRAYLRRASLRRTSLRGVDLREADLSNADLTFALVNDEQLQATSSLTGAKMPFGNTTLPFEQSSSSE